MKKIIPYSTQYIDQDDIQSVNKVLLSKNLTKGKKTIEFEKKIKNNVGSKYALAVINASSALILACKAIGLKKNDLLWTTDITYISSATAGLHCGAKIDLVDINLDDYNMCIKSLEEKLIHSKINKCLPKVVVVVHLAGYPAELKKIHQLSKKYNFKIIEDASHAFGSRYAKTKIGDCKYSDIAVFSFHPVKIITTAEGGAITTNNKNLYNKLLQLRENGIIRNKFKKFHNDPNSYDVIDLGYNFRINEINSALGISQIKKMISFKKKKRKIIDYYFNNLDISKIHLPNYMNDRVSSWHLFIVRFKQNVIRIKRKDKIINSLKKKGIFVNTHYIPLHYFKYIKKHLSSSHFPNAEDYYKSSISIPLYPHLSNKEQKLIVNNIID
jgi:UDP-4-amino-4,6-dideoxy-N-acetyl-beta-L-altrosamine transaminase